MKRLFFDCGTRDATASLGLFVLRAGAGLMMLLGHGLLKLQNYQAMLDAKQWHSPEIWPFSGLDPKISLICAIAAEVGASGMIVLGLMTRPAAFVLGFTMVVAAFHTMGQAPWFPSAASPMAKEPALMFLLPAVVLILTGAGSWSLDAVICRDGSKRRRW